MIEAIKAESEGNVKHPKQEEYLSGTTEDYKQTYILCQIHTEMTALREDLDGIRSDLEAINRAIASC